MADANPHVIAILNSEQYPAELRAKALELIAQTGLESERRRSEEDARRENLGLERTKLWLNTPFIAAFAGLLTLGATHVLSSIQSKETATLANTHVRSLEERKFPVRNDQVCIQRHQGSEAAGNKSSDAN